MVIPNAIGGFPSHHGWQLWRPCSIALSYQMPRGSQSSGKSHGFPNWLVVGVHPSEKYEFVNWDDEIPNIWDNKKYLKMATKPPTSKNALPMGLEKISQVQLVGAGRLEDPLVRLHIIRLRDLLTMRSRPTQFMVSSTDFLGILWGDHGEVVRKLRWYAILL